MGAARATWLLLWLLTSGHPQGTTDTFRVVYLSDSKREDEASFSALHLALENYLEDYNDTTLLHRDQFKWEK